MGVMAVRGTLSHWINYFFGEGRGRGEIARLKDFKKEEIKRFLVDLISRKKQLEKKYGTDEDVEKCGCLENIPISPLTLKK